VTLAVGISAWAEFRMTPFASEPWWMLPLLVVGLIVFLYPVGLAWVAQRVRRADDRFSGIV